MRKKNNEAYAISMVNDKLKNDKSKSVKSDKIKNTKLNANKQKKINKEMFIAAVAERTGLTQATVSTVFDAYQEEIIDRVTNNEEVSITGFGRFYLQRHKGHPVQFSIMNETVHDYVVFKFSASNVLNNKLRTLDSICRLD